MKLIFCLFGFGAVAGALWLTKNDSGGLGSATMTDADHSQREHEAIALMRDDLASWNDSAEKFVKYANSSIYESQLTHSRFDTWRQRNLLLSASDDLASAISVASTAYGINCNGHNRTESECSRSIDISNQSKSSIRDIGELLAEAGATEARRRFSKLPWHQRLWMK